MASQRRAELAGRSIVVAEDDPQLLDLIVRSLREAGAAVFPAYDVEAAGAICLYLKTDLLITNTLTARRAGGDFARELHKARPGLAVLRIEDRVAPHATAEARMTAAAPSLRAPFTPDVLLRTVIGTLEHTPIANERVPR